MPRTNKTIVNYCGGIVAPKVRARIDLDAYPSWMAQMQNFICEPQGGARFRNGTTMVKMSRQNKRGVLIPFQFNDSQAYLIEATDLRFRFYKDNSSITETAKNITNVTQATPGVVTSNAHGFSNGDEVFIDSVGGMTRLNGRFFVVAGAAANTFQLNDQFGVPINTTNYGAYTSGGTVARVYTVTTVYEEAKLPTVQYAQDADTMYLTEQAYEPRKLTRSGHANWTLATFVRTADPFTSPHWPCAVAFLDTGRVCYAGTDDEPETFWGSKAPSAGTPDFDNFTIGTADTDAFSFTVTPLHGKVESIQALSNIQKGLVLGGFGSIRKASGASGASISPTSVQVPPINNKGMAKGIPYSDGESLFYIQRGSQVVRSLEYSIEVDGYKTNDRSIVAEHLTRPGLLHVVGQQGYPDVLWFPRKDGKLLGLTVRNQENISGWHQHVLGGAHVNDSSITIGNARVLWAGIMPRPNNSDQLWLFVERRIGANTVRTIEYVNDEPDWPLQENFYTGDEDADQRKYLNALYEAQKDAIHLDMASSYDGSDYGAVANATVTPAAVTGSSVVFTASAAVFTPNMVGREIRKKYDSNGDGGGVGVITGYTDSTHVTCRIEVDFDNINAMAAGNWFLTANQIVGLEHFNNQTINVVADGGQHNDCLVTDGVITLDSEYTKVHVGYKYKGILETLNIDTGGITGSAQAKTRNVIKCAFNFLNAVGCDFGPDKYDLQHLVFRNTIDISDRPVPVFNGIRIQGCPDKWESEGKKLYLVQDIPSPCTVLSMDVFTETTDE